MNQERRTPFILQLLKLPIWIIISLLYLVGVPICFPLFIYCLITTPFIFNSKFDTNKTFYMVWWLPRALAAFGTLTLAGGELGAIYWTLAKFTKFATISEFIITEISVLIFTGASFTFGIKFIKQKIGFSNLRNPKEYLWVVFYGFQDILSLILTAFTVLLVSRIKELLKYKFESNRRNYLSFVLSKFFESLLDLICFPFWIIITITVWRLFYTRRVIQKMKPGSRKRLFVIYQGINVILDVIFIPFLLAILLNPFFKARRTLYHMNKLSVVVWRKLIIDEFTSTMLDILSFTSFLISACTLYELPLAIKLYTATLKKCSPFEFVDEERAFLQIENDNKDDDEAQQQIELYEKVVAHNKTEESQYHSRYFVLLFLIFVDVIFLVANLLLILSIYRYIIFQRKIRAKRLALEANENDLKNPWEALSYTEYRSYIHYMFKMEVEVPGIAPKFSIYPTLIISEALNLILDIPFIVLCSILIIAPWRAFQLIKVIQIKWEKLDKISNVQSDEPLRRYIFNAIIISLFDWLCIGSFGVSMLAPWRISSCFSSLKTNLRSGLSRLEYSPIDFVSQTLNALMDALFIPLLIVTLVNPFLKGKRLVHHMKILPVSAWRRLILSEFCSTVLDVPSFACLVFSVASLYEIPAAFTLYQATLNKIHPFIKNNLEDGLVDHNETNTQTTQQETSLYSKIVAQNRAQDTGYRLRYFLLAMLVFVDILVAVSNLLLMMSVYRCIILQRKIKTRRQELEDLENNQKEKYEALSYSEYRDYISFILTPQAEIPQDAPMFSTYPSMILTEILRLLFDLPIIAASMIFTTAPWRARHVIKAAQLEWKLLAEIQPPRHEVSFQYFVVSEVILGLVDYVCFAFFLMSLIAFWRYPYIISELIRIRRSEFSDLTSERSRGFSNRTHAFTYFATNMFGVDLVDLLYLPFFLCLLPFYFICFWRINLLKDCLNTFKKNEFSKQRNTILEIGILCVEDAFSFIPLILTVTTMYRVPTLRRMLKPRKQEKPALVILQEMPLETYLIDKTDKSVELNFERECDYAPPIFIEQEELAKSVDGDFEKNKIDDPLLSELLINQNLQAERSLQLFSAQQKVGQIQVQIDIQRESYDAKSVQAQQQITYKVILSQRKYIALLDASIKCSMLLLLDLLSIPLLIMIYLNYSLIDKYNKKLQQLQGGRATARGVTEHYEVELKACMSKFSIGFKSIGLLILKIFLVIVFSILLWRSPTLLILITKSELQDKLYFLPSENYYQYQYQQQNKKKIAAKMCSIIRFCVSQLITDLIYAPIFAALTILTPWRLWPALKAAYKYDDKSSIDAQIDEQRSLVISQFTAGLGDIFTVLKLIIIIATLFRIPFLVIITKKNRFNRLEIYEPHLKDRLSIERCISITFRELVKDIWYIPFALLLLVIAPWRVFSLYHIFMSQIDRVPSHNTHGKNAKVYSKRSDIPSMICPVLVIDYVNIFKITLAVLTIYKIFSTLKLIFHYVLNSGRYVSGELSFTREVHSIYKEARKSLINIFFSFIILVYMFRVPKTFQRLRNYQKNMKERRSVKITQHQQKSQNSLAKLDWKIYNQLSQFLTVQDLARLSQVNKDLYVMNQNDAFWQYQADRDWNIQKNWNNEITFKEKCIRTVKESHERKKMKILDENQLDSLYGENYILFDEVVKSISGIPQILLFPAKVLGSLMWCLMGRNTQFSQFIPKRSSQFIDIFRRYSSHSETLKKWIPSFEESNTFKKIHYGLAGWILLILLKYICEIGYLFSYLCRFIVKITSAGEVSPIEVITNDATGEHTMVTLKKKEQLTRTKNRFTAFLIYLIQSGFICTEILLLAASFATPAYAMICYLQWPFYQAIFGPCFLFLVHYCTIINVILTQGWYIIEAAPYFRPYRAATEIVLFFWFLLMTFCQYLSKMLKTICQFLYKILLQIVSGLKIIAKTMAKIVLFIWNTLVQGLRLIGTGIKMVLLFIYKQSTTLLTWIYKGYIGILVRATTTSLKCGIVGDILLTVFALLWMLWPLVIPTCLASSIYFIPCGLISLILVYVGYKTIQQAQNTESQNDK